jgi:hypothetical protein
MIQVLNAQRRRRAVKEEALDCPFAQGTTAHRATHLMGDWHGQIGCYGFFAGFFSIGSPACMTADPFQKSTSAIRHSLLT